jgi:hypothetical protein
MNRNINHNDRKVLLVDGSARQVLPLAKSFHDLGCFVATYNGSKFDMGYASSIAAFMLIVALTITVTVQSLTRARKSRGEA